MFMDYTETNIKKSDNGSLDDPSNLLVLFLPNHWLGIAAKMNEVL